MPPHSFPATEWYSRLLLLPALLLPVLALATDESPPRPNILYFYVDDMGWGSIGPNGQAERRAQGLPSVKTPNLDRLAAEGVNFTRAYGATVCSPARSAQQTGYHQGHAFADRNDPDNAKKAMRADDVTMGDALSAAGYVTGYWGKWGYGGTKDQIDPQIVNVQTLPTSHGYRHVLAELHHVRAHTFFQPTLWGAPATEGAKGGLELVPNSLARWDDAARYPDTFTRHRDPAYPGPAYCDDAYCFSALEFVRAQAANFHETGQPFFGLLAVQIPHAPFAEIAKLPGWDAAYRDDPHFAKLAPQSQQWAAMVTRIDAHFGLILEALEDPDGDGDRSDSIADDTLVIFMSDNGGPKGKNNEEFDANGGLRGNKGSIYEGGIRVPTVMRWPAMISADSKILQAGTDSDEVIDVTDLLPTFCELAGEPAPLGVDGVSLAPLLTGKPDQQRQREFVIHEAGRLSSIIRGNHKLIRSGPANPVLYDLEADPRETRDIAGDEPELVKQLETLLLGERVTEPKGFANTYHHWTGKDGASATEAANWSDYVYANEGITYLTDDGAPQLSWTAKMRNTGNQAMRAVAGSDLDFLALEIGGNENATQELRLEPGVQLSGRNEIRLSRGGILTLDESTVTSLRWIDVLEGGLLRGSGAIDAEVFNAGTLEIDSSADIDSAERGLRVAGDYRQGPTGELRIVNPGISGSDDRNAIVQVTGQASLAGALVPRWNEGDPAFRVGDRISLLSARSVHGRFDLPGDRLVTENGIVFRLHYHRTGVEAVIESLPREPFS